LKERSNSPWETDPWAAIGWLAGFVAVENKSKNQVGGVEIEVPVWNPIRFFVVQELRVYVGWNFRFNSQFE